MDTNTGKIINEKQVKELTESYYQARNENPTNTKRLHKLKRKIKLLVPMELQPTQTQRNRKSPKVGRNEPCPCGSGKKFKHCCLTR